MQIQSLESFIQNLPGLFFLKNKDSQYRAATRHFQQFCRFAGENNLLGCDDYALPWAKYADIYRKADHQVMQQNKSLVFLEPLRLQSGKDILVLSRKAPFYNDAQEIIGLSCNLTIVSSPRAVKEISILTKNDFELLGLTIDKSIQYTIVEDFEEFNLTKKEVICLFYLLRGMTAKEIALTLSKSIRTIEKHIIHIKQKLNCNSKSEVIAKAIEYGFVHFVPTTFLTQFL